MKRLHLLGLAALSGTLLALGWVSESLPLILCVALVPLLYIEDYFSDKQPATARLAVWKYSFITFFIWNLLATWWIYYSTLAGVILAVGLNSLLMSGIFLIFHIIKQIISPRKSNTSIFIIFWLLFEYAHHHWQVSWPWLSLGNAFGATPQLVQWYEFTGSYGGSLWVLLVNAFLFLTIKQFKLKRSPRFKFTYLALTVITFSVPLVISYSLYNSYIEQGSSVEVVVLQPNKDPWSEQYGEPAEKNITDLLQLANSQLDENTDFVVGPESALYDNIWESTLFRSRGMKMIDTFLQQKPNLELVIGASTRRLYRDGEEPSETAHYVNNSVIFDAYNTAIRFGNNQDFSLRHKSKLVPGVEFMPFNSVMRHVQNLVFDLGGMTGTLGTDSCAVVFTSKRSKIKIAPIICFESIYSEYVRSFVHKGANLIFVITNDGWWSDSPGYRQHFNFSALRAIETRRSVARAANTGVSAFINQKGEVEQSLPFWTKGALKQKMLANNKQTFFVTHGDMIGKPTCFVALMLTLIALSRWLIQRKK